MSQQVDYNKYYKCSKVAYHSPRQQYRYYEVDTLNIYIHDRNSHIHGRDSHLLNVMEMSICGFLPRHSKLMEPTVNKKHFLLS